MNWLEGAGDPLVWAILPVVATVLAATGLAILALAPALRKRRPALLRELGFRWALWVAIAALVLAALEGGRITWIVGVGLLMVMVLREYIRSVGLWQDWGIQAVLYAFLLLFCATSYGGVFESDPELGSYGLFIVLPVWGTVFLLAVPVLRGRFEGMLQRLALAILGLVYVVFFLAHYAFLINLPGGVGLVLFLSFLVAANDVGAFVAGKLLGRHPLRSTLSPAKTWEGAAGGFAAVLALGYALAWLLPSAVTLPHVLVMSGLVAVCAAFGDLATSGLKRDLGIKDWSAALPGHGGFLDRANSLVFAAPVFFHYYRFFFMEPIFFA